MAQIDKPNLHFNTKLYTGTGSTHNITGVGFQPDLVWVKKRNNADDHNLVDAVRGVTKYLQSNTNIAEATYAGNVSAFGTDGFTVGDGNQVNQNTHTFASWNWKANGSGSSNTDGTITSTVSANTTAGFSIVSYTGNATAGATVGHGLGATPGMIIVKVRSTSNNWAVYHKSMGATKAMYLDGTSAETTDGWLNNTAPTSSVFTLSGGNYGNTNGNTHIAYCFAEKKGFSKFGNYTGNGSSGNPTYIYTGFKPAFVMVKNTSQADGWFMHDDKRDGYNDDNEYLFANLSNVEGSNINRIRFYSNGFSVPTTDKSHNVNGNGYIYMAFAENPIVGSNNVPATAR